MGALASFDCPACGTRLRGGRPGAVLACAHCGAPVVVPAVAAPPSAPAPPPSSASEAVRPEPPPFDAAAARGKLLTTAALVLALVAVAHLGLYMLLTRDARASIAGIEARHDARALEAARAPAGEAQPGSEEYKAWREAKARYVDAETWRSDKRQVALLRGGIIVSFVVQVAITGWILLRLLGSVRRRARRA